MPTPDRAVDRRSPEPASRTRDADVVPLRSHPGRLPTSTPGQSPTVDHEPPLREVIGDVLRDERHAQERTLAEVAAGAFVSLPYLSELERGLKEPSSEVLASICAALDVPLADVLERSADRLRAGTQGQGRIQLLAA